MFENFLFLKPGRWSSFIWNSVLFSVGNVEKLTENSKSVQFSSSVASGSLRPHGLQHSRPPCPSPTPGVYSGLTSIESVMPSSHLILSHPLLLLPSIFPSIRVFSSEPCLLENIIWIDEAQLLISFIIHIFYPILDIFAKSKVFKIFLLCFLPEMLMVLICI